MKRGIVILGIVLVAAWGSAQTYETVMVDSNGVVQIPANFFDANNLGSITNVQAQVSANASSISNLTDSIGIISNNLDAVEASLITITQALATAQSDITLLQAGTSKWDTAYAWGNHAAAGYLTNAAAFDPAGASEAVSNALDQVAFAGEVDPGWAAVSNEYVKTANLVAPAFTNSSGTSVAVGDLSGATDGEGIVFHFATGTWRPSTNQVMQKGDDVTSLDSTAWRVFYSDGGGNVTALAFPAAEGYTLQFNGASTAPTIELLKVRVAPYVQELAIYSVATNSVTLSWDTAAQHIVNIGGTATNGLIQYDIQMPELTGGARVDLAAQIANTNAIPFEFLGVDYFLSNGIWTATAPPVAYCFYLAVWNVSNTVYCITSDKESNTAW